MMKVLYFTRDYNAHDQRFLAALAKTNHQIYLLRLESNPFTTQPRIYPQGVEDVKWIGGNDLFRWSEVLPYVKDLKRVFKLIAPDVVHAGPVHTCAYLAALAGFRPLVTMSWASDILYEVKHDPWLAKASKYALKRTSVLVGDCQAVADKAREYKFPENRIILFPWGVDLVQFNPIGTANLRKKLGWEDKFVTLCLRSWEPVYGVDVTLQAFARAAGEIPDLRLLLFGNGSQENQIHELISQHGLKDRVYLGGKIRNADLPDVYRSADIYLTATHSDGSSVSLMEAMACGLPAVASDIPGNLEWVQPGHHGWIFPDCDIQKMTDSILDALSQREELSEMSQNVRQYAEVRADWNKNFPKLLHAYDLAVGDPS